MSITNYLRYLPVHAEEARTIREIAGYYQSNEDNNLKLRNIIRNIERLFEKHAGELFICKKESINGNLWYWDISRFNNAKIENLGERLKRNIGQCLEESLLPRPSLIEMVNNDLTTSKIDAYTKEQALDFWLNRVYYSESTLRFHPINYSTGILETVVESINRNRTVSMTVHTRRGQGRERNFENVQFVSVLQHGVNTDLIFIMNGNPVNKYRVQLHRINRISLNTEGRYIPFDFKSWVNKTGGLFNDPADGTIDEYVQFEDLGRIFEPRNIEFKAYIHNDLQEELVYTKIEKNQTITKIDKSFSGDGLPWYLLEFKTYWSEQLTWWIMSWGQRIIILSPGELNKLIRSRLTAAVENYKLLD